MTEISRKGWTNVIGGRSDYDEPARTYGSATGERSSLLTTGGGYTPVSGSG